MIPKRISGKMGKGRLTYAYLYVHPGTSEAEPIQPTVFKAQRFSTDKPQLPPKPKPKGE